MPERITFPEDYNPVLKKKLLEVEHKSIRVRTLGVKKKNIQIIMRERIRDTDRQYIVLDVHAVRGHIFITLQ